MSTTPAVICLDLGGSFVKLGVMDAQQQLTMLDQQTIPADSWQNFTALVSRMIQQHQLHFSTDSPLAISTAGIVAPDSGEMFASNIPAFINAPAVRWASYCNVK
ncbi:hypothetical protein LZ023_35130 (plasmid) [Pseudomonas silvicola]|nr:hypothetical protein LZ023_35130 [Pseudomonas silvicola]